MALGYFSDSGSFFKMAITRKIDVGIGVAYLHQYVSENVIKILGDFEAVFLEKIMGYSFAFGYFSDSGSFFKMAITQKIEVGIGSNFLRSIFTMTMARLWPEHEN